MIETNRSTLHAIYTTDKTMTHTLSRRTATGLQQGLARYKLNASSATS